MDPCTWRILARENGLHTIHERCLHPALGDSSLAQYIYLEIQTPVDGAITGAVIGATRTVTYFAVERTILNIYIDWLIIIGTGIVFGEYTGG